MTLQIETRVVQIPNVGPMFRRVFRTPDGEEVKVEYMTVCHGEFVLVPADETLVGAGS